MIGASPLGVALGAVEIVKTMVWDRPAIEQRVALMVLMMLAQQAEADEEGRRLGLWRLLLLDSAPFGDGWLG